MGGGRRPGEITVVVAGGAPRRRDMADLVAEVEELVAGGTRLKDACAQVTRDGGASRRDLYQAVLAHRQD
ncbi:Ribosomal RNA small subunit methyltransferase I [Gordonia insulae]|uniref:Ribosomal RNA small subunit methyltransferase I n=1 Tax=Gordonia insulae TaxID=2420509 RepID=A0A3G8JJB6_9ACTN|nr:Ribosomal RNA small subunit methyltransferase I [Gordonia insulae]